MASISFATDATPMVVEFRSHPQAFHDKREAKA